LQIKIALAKKNGVKAIRVNAGISKYSSSWRGAGDVSTNSYIVLYRGQNIFVFKKEEQDAHYSMLWATFMRGENA
jgi:hypothetical protein